jgi:NAD-reducing hydrogenase small subunit
MLLNKVHPIHEVVKVDHFLPGCPPSADAIWTFLTELIAGKPVSFPYEQIHYD